MNIDSKRKNELAKFEKRIGYSFKNISLLSQALTHSSYNNGSDTYTPHYERLEFVGDSILGFIIGLYLYEYNKKVDEGQLTRVRATIVCEQSLHLIAEQLQMGQYILMSRGEEQTGGRKRVSILADTVESVIAAIYLDSNIEVARSFVIKHFAKVIEDAIHDKLFSDYKSLLQEFMQKKGSGEITYETLSEDGPDHDKTFDVSVIQNNKNIGYGSGKSKKDAQQAAAKDAIGKLGIKNE